MVQGLDLVVCVMLAQANQGTLLAALRANPDNTLRARFGVAAAEDAAAVWNINQPTFGVGARVN